MTRTMMWFLCWAWLTAIAPAMAGTKPLRIAAASDLQYVLPVLIHTFEQQSGYQVSSSFAASGNLVSQIRHGAPYDIFMSANAAYIRVLKQAGLTRGAAIAYGSGSLALFVPQGSPIKLDKGLSGLRSAIEQHQVNKIVIANPMHAPYGQATQVYLQRVGLWNPVAPLLLRAENAAQVVQFTLISGVDAGFIPYGHAIQPAIARQGRSLKLPQSLQQYAVQLKTDHAAASGFLEFLQSEPAQAILQQYGYDHTEAQ